MSAPARPLATYRLEPVRRLAVLGLGERPHVAREAERLRPLLESHAQVVAWDMGFTEDLSRVDADLAIVLGGDGSILRAARQMGARQIPVLGVNLGKLGFLADLQPQELLSVLPQLAGGGLMVREHLMYRCRVERAGRTVLDQLGLNDVVLQAGPTFGMIQIHLFVDGEPVTTYSCDGLIVSTPIGSTAHSLAAGGPILRKDLLAFIISPLSPHALTMRPVVDSADRVYELTVPRPNAGTWLVVDGRALVQLTTQDRVRIEQASERFKLVEVPGHGYYRTLREKLGWGGRPSSEPG